MKPKVVGGQHVECGGAMVSKLPNVTWPKGTFMETIKGWQHQWLYVTEPRNATERFLDRGSLDSRTISFGRTVGL